MKNSLTYFLALICIPFLVQCDPEKQIISFDEDFRTSEISENTDMKSIISDFKQEESEYLSFDSDYIISGIVVSSAESGNFYKTLILQDKPINPRLLSRSKLIYEPTFQGIISVGKYTLT